MDVTTTATAIPGTPEGRPGVWLVEPAVAAAVIDAAPGEDVHCFIGHDTAFIGADWTKDQAREFVWNQTGLTIAMVFPPNVTMKHQLVAITSERRWAFDVGEIAEVRMMEKEPLP